MAAESEEDSYMLWMDDPDPVNNNNNNKKRRFSEDQVKSLELMFESQAKLEPRKKLQLAKDLGLHPRQVAIWFQNKRARWKSKQLEREYNRLKADYDALLSNFESIKNQKQALTEQLHKLVELVNNPGGTEERRKEDDVRLTMCSNKFREKEKADLLYAVEEEDSTLVPSEHQFCVQQPSWPSSDQSGSATWHWWDFWPLNG